MKTTLKKTLDMAKKGVITDRKDIKIIINDVLSIPLTELEHASHWFDFVRKFEYIEDEDEREKYYESLTLKNALQIVDMFRADEEDKDLCFYLRSVMMGILESYSIKDIRLFHSISLLKFLKVYKNIDHEYFFETASRYFNIVVRENMSMYDFFCILKRKFYEPWDICRDIGFLETEILTCGELLDTILCDCMLSVIE